MQVELFASAQEFLRSKRPDAPSCLVLDIRLPGISGLDFQRQLAEANIHIPIILSLPMEISHDVRAMKAGAVEFLTKPFAIRICGCDSNRVRAGPYQTLYKRQKLQAA